MTNAQVAAYLGIASDSVTNWQAAQRYLKPIVEAMDAGRLTMQAARVFDGMTEAGQKTIWKAHSKELMRDGAGAHKKFRALYPPTSFPDFYREPKLITKRLKMKGGKRASRGMSAGEKQRMADSVELKEIEVREGNAKADIYERQIKAAIPVIAAIVRNPEVLALVSEESRANYERFAEVFI